MAKILVVDDRPSNRQFLVKLLGYVNHQLLEASDGAEALELVREHRPDLVVSDILMPTMDGFEFVRRLRADADIARTSVLFYTASYHVSQVAGLAHACGVRYVLEKPSKPEVVLRTVEKALDLGPASTKLPAAEQFYPEHERVVCGKLSEEKEELAAQLATIIEHNLELSSERDPQRLLENFCRAAREIIGAKHAVVCVPNEDRQAARAVFVSGMDAETAESVQFTPPEQGVFGTVLKERCSCRLRNLKGEPEDVGLPPHYPRVSPESRRRLEAILSYAGKPTPDDLRASRGTEVLEVVSSAEARSLLGDLARGPANHRLAVEAEAAVNRARAK